MVLVGLDEAGAGPAFGSLWASAVSLYDEDTANTIPGLTDSKKVSERKRETLRKLLLDKVAQNRAHYGLGEVTAQEIDELGLGEARRLVFERALDDFVHKEGAPMPSKLIVDGTLFRAWRDVPFECVPRADASVPCVSAASILAKTTRDAQVLACVESDPSLDVKYGLRKNKGYLAPVHIQGLREHGRSALHRHSYRIRGVDA